MSEPASESQKWKERYLASLDELEDSKKLFESELDTLKKALVRVSLAADGVDGRLDGYLSSLRDSVRKNDEVQDIERVIAKIERLLRELDEGRKESQDSTQEVFNKMVQNLAGVGVNRSIKKKIKQFEKEVRELIDNSDNHGHLVQQYLLIQEEVLGQLETGKEKKEGFWKKLVKSENEKESIAGDSHPIEGDELEICDDDDLETSSASTQQTLMAEYEAVKERVSGVLVAFLDQLEIPSYLNNREEKVRHLLKQGFPWPELPETLSESISLLIGSNNEAQKEFEGFLLALNSRLVEIHQVFERSQENQLSQVESSKMLNEQVKSTIREIQSNVETSVDIVHLKKAIATQLDSITNVVDNYKDEVTQSNDDIFNCIKSLGERMEAMEKEANELKDTIEQQRQQTMKDNLTGLSNRSAYVEYVEKELARTRRHELNLSLVVCDIDHFKSINDTFGHLSGDKVLKLVAGCIEKNVRVSDFVARYGGEEFVIMMPETSLQDATKAADKVRKAIDECAFHFKAKPVSITASFGVAQIREDDSIDTLFERADKALYKAKQGGRNQVCQEELSRSDENSEETD